MELRLNLGEFRILLALERGATTIAEIRRRVAETMTSAPEISLGGIYTVLEHLLSKGLIDSTPDVQPVDVSPTAGPYALTPLGRRALRRSKDSLRALLDDAPDPVSAAKSSKSDVVARGRKRRIG